MVVNLTKRWVIPPNTHPYGCFQKWWYPTTMGFPTKNDHFGVFWGYPYFWKPPYQHWVLMSVSLGDCQHGTGFSTSTDLPGWDGRNCVNAWKTSGRQHHEMIHRSRPEVGIHSGKPHTNPNKDGVIGNLPKKYHSVDVDTPGIVW